eukprot:TRINITY_DN324_c0_g1_i1.p1 TRINITY_DN324_c0_g1~~TRINITY_DN324_c0_g1_i1.p1  ORF type:complete len:274 (+),score=66.55 TRINITY_DN324_c0_g1_i1:92-913(+)
MEIQDIGVVLSRTSELRFKVTECIKKGFSDLHSVQHRDEESDLEGNNPAGLHSHFKEKEDIETQSLIHIRNALESLEMQLSSLQSLQRQQQLEREAALTELDESRRVLVDKLEHYRGRELGVIRDACVFAFAGEPSQQMDDIMLPPYGQRLPNPFIRMSDYSLSTHTAQAAENIVANHLSKDVSGNSTASRHSAESDMEQHPQNNSENECRKTNFLGQMIQWTTKTVLVIASVASVYIVASLEPKLNKRGTLIKLSVPLPKQMDITSAQLIYG